MLDVYIYRYNSVKWSWKYATGIGQKLFNSEDEAIEHARYKNREATIYVEQKDGKFKKLR